MSIYKIYTNTLVNNAKPKMTLYIELQIMSIYKIYTNTLVNNAKPEVTLYIELQIMSIYMKGQIH
jgi:hypothetical protein